VQDRLEYIRHKLKNRKVYYSRYSPRSELFYEIEDADEDMNWLVYEVERLRAESARRQAGG